MSKKNERLKRKIVGDNYCIACQNDNFERLWKEFIDRHREIERKFPWWERFLFKPTWLIEGSAHNSFDREMCRNFFMKGQIVALDWFEDSEKKKMGLK